MQRQEVTFSFHFNFIFGVNLYYHDFYNMTGPPPPFCPVQVNIPFVIFDSDPILFIYLCAQLYVMTIFWIFFFGAKLL